jgi:signal transduction histidine kinase
MKIYRKLYFWFLLVFIFTIAVVSLMIHRFYTERVRDELHEQLQSHARFLISEYEQACEIQESPSCKEFMNRLKQISPIRFWILSTTGQLQLSNASQSLPRFRASDLSRAKRGEVVIVTRHRAPPYIVMPIQTPDGGTERLAVIERGFITGRRFPRFPVFLSLVIVLITIAIFIFPLSKRLTRPVRELHELGQEWAEGHLEKRARVRGKDEIAELATTFNTMAENLQKMLNQRKEFLASISHELKSPLARMRIAVELLNERTEGQENTLDLLQNIQREIEESEKLIEQLLVLSKIEMNAPMIQERVQLEKVSQKAIEQVEPLARRGGIGLTCSGSATIRGDFYQLEKALLNILENAVKFSKPSAPVRIEIASSNGFAFWKCLDQGAGINTEEQEKIFEPFYRGDRVAGKEGSGLGLFIAKRIVEMHGGMISAENNEWNGITIVMRFPLFAESR